MSKIKILLIPLILYQTVWAQSNDASQRIAEVYQYLEDNHNLYGKEVLIFDYKLKNKKTIKDSTLVAQFTIVKENIQEAYEYDTSQYEVIKYELKNGLKIPYARYKHNENWDVTEAAIINEEFQLLSKTFYKYDGEKLVSEEAYTGYAYLDNPRKISVITYQYKGDQLVERDKKYSLNGSHWVQTWVSKFDDKGNCYYKETTADNETLIERNSFDEKRRIILSEITQENQKTKVKEISYYVNNAPKSVWIYDKKSKKTERLTKYFYQ